MMRKEALQQAAQDDIPIMQKPANGHHEIALIAEKIIAGQHYF